MTSRVSYHSTAAISSGDAAPSPRLAYSVADAAALTGLGRTTLYALMAEGRLASRKIGKRRIIRRTDLLALLNDEQEDAA